MKKLGIIGFGTMGEIFAVRMRQKEPEMEIRVYDVREERRAAAQADMGLFVAESPGHVVRESDLVILAVKPQDLSELLPQIRDHSHGKEVISILAGKGIDTIAAGLHTQRICRFMPNIAASKGAALVAVSFHKSAPEAYREECLGIARCLGTAMEIPEKLMAAFTGVCASGIAYVFSFVHSMALGGVASGFDYHTALRAAIGALEGAVALLEDGGHPSELASRVVSPAGTTIQGVRALEKGGFNVAVMEAVEAAARRAQELEG
jgi:pyrroline-5-carboxylate reductase